MAAKRVTSKDVLDAIAKVIDSVEEHSPNGRLERLHEKIDYLTTSQVAHTKIQEKQFKEINQSIHKLEKRLYNPDDGLVVTLNENIRVTKETRDWVKKQSPKVDKLEDDMDDMIAWKSGIMKMVWIIVPTVLTAIGYAAKLAFFK